MFVEVMSFTIVSCFECDEIVKKIDDLVSIFVMKNEHNEVKGNGYINKK